jgi:hypothetical protein
MIVKPMNIKSASTKSFNLRGGLNTEIANMERGPGELLVCQNYHEVSGAYSGYQSTKGYERYDGSALASSIPTETVSNWITGKAYVVSDRVSSGGFVYVCKLNHTSGVFATDLAAGDKWTYEAVSGEEDFFKDVNRETQRATILPVGDVTVPGENTDDNGVNGLHIYNGKVYAWRCDQAIATKNELYVEHATTHWTKVDPAVGAANVMAANGNISAINGRFQGWESNNEVMFWVDGVSDGFFWYNGADSEYQIEQPTQLPSSATPPKRIGIWENRLFLVYETGDIFFSNTGDPRDFDSATGTAGQIDIGEPVTGLIATVGVLIVFTRGRTKIIRMGSTTGQFIFKLDEFSANTGALDGTVDSHFESIMFCSDRGVHRMIPSADMGGFTTEALTDKIIQNFLDIKDRITTTLIDNRHSRYYVFYNNIASSASYGYTFTLYKGKLKGVGQFRFRNKMLISAQGILSDGTDMIVTGDSAGYVYRIESGTSFDGYAIPCRFTTSYYHYGSPRNWKYFQRIVFEMVNDVETTYNVAPVFDYGDTALSRHSTEDKDVIAGSSIWGEGINWGSFVWGAGELGKAILYIQGHAQNMAITVRTSNKYGGQHTIHNITTDFIQEATRQ